MSVSEVWAEIKRDRYERAKGISQRYFNFASGSALSSVGMTPTVLNSDNYRKQTPTISFSPHQANLRDHQASLPHT